MAIDLQYDTKTVAGALSNKAVAEIEEMTHLRFPADYLEHMRQHNGGKPLKRVFDLNDNKRVIDRVLCIIDDYKTDEIYGVYDIGVVWSQAADRLGDYLVPFASLFAGDLLCFDYENRADPQVVIWDHERSDDASPVTYPVARNFTELLSMLHLVR